MTNRRNSSVIRANRDKNTRSTNGRIASVIPADVGKNATSTEIENRTECYSVACSNHHLEPQ